MKKGASADELLRLARRAMEVTKQHGVSATLTATWKYVRSRARLSNGTSSVILRYDAQGAAHTFHFRRPDGAVVARRPSRSEDVAVHLPRLATTSVVPDTPIAVIIHAYHIDLLESIISYVKNIEYPYHVYISTDTETKSAEAASICIKNDIAMYSVRVFPNIGRDIAPKIVGYSDVYSNHDIFIHLHTKKSLHLSRLKGWRTYLMDSLLGGSDVVKNIIELFMMNKKLGIVFPSHYIELGHQLNWGHDFGIAQDLLSRAGWQLSKDSILEFPSGSMFWGRSKALKRLLDLNLEYGDFPAETGQIDGTLAHAIERSYLHFAEAAGYSWLKIAGRGTKHENDIVLENYRDQRINTEAYKPLFIEPGKSQLAISRNFAELRPLNLCQTASQRPRLNVLLPTIMAKHVFGGVATAIRIFEDLAEELNWDRRIIVTDSPALAEDVASYPSYSMGSRSASRSIFDAFDRHKAMDVREKDVFISTAWWSEYLRHEIKIFQERSYATCTPSLYLIQDYESNFNPWSSRWAICESTYTLGSETIPIINSEELAEFIKLRFGYNKAFLIPYEINERIFHGIEDIQKEKIILCYGRPSAYRNCFEIIIDGIALWQQRHPLVAENWKIHFVGEEFTADQFAPVQNAIVLGKLTLEEYAKELSRASVGLSFMISPHPSYPPLEMAQASIITVTNNYDCKNMNLRSENIRALDFVTPEALCSALESAVCEAGVNIGKIMPKSTIRRPQAIYPIFDTKIVAPLIDDMLKE